MRSDQENKTKHSQYQIETLKEQLTKMNLEDEKRRCEYDRILLTTKNRLEDEEVKTLYIPLNAFNISR